MEDEPGQDVVAISHTAWGVNKRPASPLDIDVHTSKRSWSSITRHKATGQPLVIARDRGHDSHLRNAASRWDSGGFHGDPALGSAANNSLSYQYQSFHGRGVPTSVGLTGTWDQYLLPGHDECGFGPVLHFRPDVNHYPVSVGDPLSHISQSQSPTTALTGLGLPLPSVNRSFPPGPLPTSAQSQTPPYTPYTPYNSEISGSDNAYLPTDMRVPTSPTGGQKQYGGSYPEVHQARDHFTVHSRSSVPLHRLTQYDQVLAVGSTDYDQQPSRTVPGVEGYPAVLPHSLNTFHEFSNGPVSAAITHDYAAPVIGSDSSDAAFGGSLRHGPMSAHPTGLEHDSWSDHDSLTIRLAVTQQYEQQQTQNLGRYIQVLHPLDGPYDAQDGDAAYSDVEETIIADDDEVGAKMQTMRSLASSTNSVDDPYPYSSSSNSSYINLSSPSSIQQEGAEHACYSRNDSTTESMGTEDFTIVPRNSSLPDKKPRKKRGEFERDKLEETNKTRLMKACVACRKQKIRCIANNDPAAPCLKCQKTTTSKSGKIIHRSLCCRTCTITSIDVVRPGGLGLTRRWEGTKMANIADRTDSIIRTIHMLQGLSRKPIVVQVRKFKPKEGDVTYRQWDDNGVQKRLDLEPYCLADIHATATYFSNYLCETALEGLREAAHSSGALVQETYRMVHEHAVKLHKRMTGESETERATKEWQLLMGVVKLVWSMRHTTGSVWLAGPDKLDMTPPQDDSYPLRNPWTREKEVSLPRLIIAQFDSIQNQRILPSQLKKVLRDLENNLSSPKYDWFTLYLAVFMLLHEISVASKDRYRWARERHQKTRYGAGKYAALGMYVENLQKAAYPLLAYWDYYNCDVLEGVDWDALDTTTMLKNLEPEQVAFMERSVQLIQEAEEANEIPQAPLPGCWEHELFFVSRMFRRDWMVGYQTFNFMDE